MKITVIGDVHARQCALDIARANLDSNYIIFLGDYVTSHENVSDEEQIRIFKEILALKDRYYNKIILLIGNHDLDALGYFWVQCHPRASYGVSDYVYSHSYDFLSNSKFLHVYQNIIFSHAGISSVWLKNTKFNLDDIHTAYPQSQYFSFMPNNINDTTGTSATQSCVWIRPQALVTCAYKPQKYIQVVGHTPVKKICDLNTIDPNYPHIWCCDNLPNEYLVIQDGEFIVKKVSDIYNQPSVS